MKKRNSINQYKPPILFLLIALLWLIFNESGIMTWYKLKNEQYGLMESIDALHNEEILIEKHINKLTNDFDYLEFIAYSRFKMVKPGEKIFRVKDYKNVKQ